MSRPAPPPRSPLSLDRIATVALALVDREGAEALTMRRLGTELGVEAMALYHHVRDKEALLELVLSRGTPGSLPEPTGAWRRDVHALARAVWRQLAAHPGLLALRWARRATSPEAEAVHAREAAIFASAGFGRALARDAHRLLGSYVVGFVVAEAQAHARADADWQAQFDVGLEMLLDGIEARRRREARARRGRVR